MPKPRVGLLLGGPCGVGPEIAAKLLAGLPFPVATAAHGTAFHIVGQGKAKPEPKVRAFEMALSLAAAAFARVA